MRDESGRGPAPARASSPPHLGTGAVARRERWARLRRTLWQPPRPHGEQPRERVVGPLELFYDLAVVVLVAQAAHRLAAHLTWPGLGEFAAVFTLVWIAWPTAACTTNCTATTTPAPHSTFLLQILILAAMGASSACRRRARSRVRHCRGGAVRGAGRLVAAGRRRRTAPNTAGRPAVRRRDRGLRRPAGRPPPCCGQRPHPGLGPDRCRSTWPGSAPCSSPPARRRRRAMMVSDALTERVGAFVIIVLGETLTGVVTGLVQPARSARSPSPSGWSRSWSASAPGGPTSTSPESTRPRPERAASLQWMLGHLPLTAAIAAMGAAMLASSTTPMTAEPPPPPPVPRPRCRTPVTADPRPRARSPAQHPLGSRRRPPPGRRRGRPG